MDPSIATFDDDYAGMRGVRTELRRSKRRVSAKEVSESAKLAIERHQLRGDAVEFRLEVGCVWSGGQVGSYFIDPFIETGLASDEQHVLRRFVAAIPRVYHGRAHERFSEETNAVIERRIENSLHAGYDKGFLPRADSKLLALDMANIELNCVMRHGWRVDLDRDFPSASYLRDQLEQLVDRGALPCLPHAVVGHVEHDGTLRRPHLWWLLPYGSQVWYDETDPRCNKRIMSLYVGVVRGCTAALLSLGADLSALANPLKGKNPLSPFWSVFFWNSTEFPDLTEWSETVDTGRIHGDLVREAAALDTGLDKSDSNAAFCAAQRVAFDALRSMHHSQDAEYLAALDDREALADLLEGKCIEEVQHLFTKKSERKRMMKMLRRVAAYAAERWEPRICGAGGKDVGACRERVKGLTTVSERQAVGAHYAAECRADKARVAVHAAIVRLRESGREITPTAIAREAGVSRPTVYKYMNDAPTLQQTKDDHANSRKRRSIDPRKGLETETVDTDDGIVIEIPMVGMTVRSSIVVTTAGTEGERIGEMTVSDEDYAMRKAGLARQLGRLRGGSINARLAERKVEAASVDAIEIPVDKGVEAVTSAIGIKDESPCDCYVMIGGMEALRTVRRVKSEAELAEEEAVASAFFQWLDRPLGVEESMRLDALARRGRI